MRIPFVLGLAAAGLAVACAGSAEKAEPLGDPAFAGMQKVEDHDVHHLIQASPRVWSGAAPEAGDEAFFRALQERGIKTIVSVDGARPDVDLARKYGMRYVHIPFGYDGIGPAAEMQLASAMEQTEGPIYFHCHHGQHRGPAAAAIALRLETGCSGEQAADLLRLAETDPKYKGLWRDVAAWTPPAKDAPRPPLHEIAPVGNFASAMASMDRTWDRVKLLQTAKWQPIAEHPDLVPAQEAKILFEMQEVLPAILDAEQKADAEFVRMLMVSIDESRALHAALAAGDAAAAETRFQALKKACSACHDAYRN